MSENTCSPGPGGKVSADPGLGGTVPWRRSGVLPGGWLRAWFTHLWRMGVRGIVTKHRNGKEALKPQWPPAFDEDNLRAMINSTKDLMWSADRNYRLIAANEPFLDSLEEVTGCRFKPGDSLMVADVPGAAATTHWHAHFERALGGEAFTTEEYVAHSREAHLQVGYAPIRANGNVVGVAMVSRDITEMRKAQLELERSHARLREAVLQKASILDALPAQVALLDPAGMIGEVNEAWRVAVERSGLRIEHHGVGEDVRSLARLLMGEEIFRREGVADGLSSVLQGRSAGYKLEYRSPAEGPPLWFQLRIAPLSSRDGAVVMHLDVTDRREAQEAVLRSHALLEDRVVERTKELLLTNEELEAETEKNKRLGREIVKRNEELMSSITYASYIQRSLIPERRKFDFFNGMGLVFRPRDVVSGDFLWCHGTSDHFVVAVADCTGHGVPGAMMSMLGHDLLDHIVVEHGEHDPRRILEQLDGAINRLFTRSEGLHVMDGMDISVVVVDKRTMELTFSGAGLPLLAIRDGAPILFPGSKATIGGRWVCGEKEFCLDRHQLRRGDRLCLFTDGYGDQFGGQQNKKLLRRGFLSFLVEQSMLDAAQAAQAIDRHFTGWMGKQEQVDDVLVLILDV